MKHIAMVLILLLLNIKYKTWNKFRANVPSLIYVTLINCFYYIFCRRKLLWEFQTEDISLKKVRLIQTFIGTPLITQLFLSCVPKQSKKLKGLYLFSWVISSTIMEWFANKKFKMVTFYNGWNTKWSVMIYLKMYLFSYLHKKIHLLLGY
ncbi:hypothetical protein BKP35_16620 [Anaerobacillus arseniciselenatis]|uniref:Uncharacterized protein n=1 Tax=Anaerobacillus arseniciselenatis TaxID=85682 RepID=A0A1S2LCN2_9BACI|nr:hypothetical protein BKP35_16620 [Anaerobacillus arseniciselenatis]